MADKSDEDDIQHFRQVTNKIDLILAKIIAEAEEEVEQDPLLSLVVGGLQDVKEHLVEGLLGLVTTTHHKAREN